MPRRLILKAWLSLQEPRKVTLMQTILYVLLGLAGAGILVWPPTSLENVTGTILSTIWGLFALVGGALGAVSTPSGKWFLERPAIYLCGTAVAFYLGILLYLQSTTPGNRLVQMAFVAIALVAMVIRFERIKAFDYEPGK